MPPGQTIPTNLSFTLARQVLKPEDMERLACAFLNATETVKFDANKAAREFGNVQPESFKRSIWMITKKLKENAGDEDGTASPVAVKSKPRGRKRKTDGEDGESPAKKKGKGGKKSKSEIEDDADDDALVKAEQKAEEDSDGDLV